MSPRTTPQLRKSKRSQGSSISLEQPIHRNFNLLSKILSKLSIWWLQRNLPATAYIIQVCYPVLLAKCTWKHELCLSAALFSCLTVLCNVTDKCWGWTLRASHCHTGLCTKINTQLFAFQHRMETILPWLVSSHPGTLWQILLQKEAICPSKNISCW